MFFPEKYVPGREGKRREVAKGVRNDLIDPLPTSTTTTEHCEKDIPFFSLLFM